MERGHSLRGETEEVVLDTASGFSLLLMCGLGQISVFLQTSQLWNGADAEVISED